MGKLIFSQGKFHFEAARPTHNYCEAVMAEEAGFHQDTESLRWVTRNPHKAVKLRQWADSSAEEKFKKYFITEFPLPQSIPYPDHLSPKVFQLESAWHCLSRSPSYCADEAGLGKTIMAVLCMNAVPGNTLIICPPFLKYNWVDEIRKWLDLRIYKNQVGKYFASISLVESGKSLRILGDGNSDIVIVPDSLLTNSSVQSLIGSRKWEWLFVDEAHRYKEATTQRTKVLLDAIIPHANRVCYLSGTPIPNGRPIELYPLLSSSAPESISWRSLETFGKTFCAGKRVTRYEGRRAISNWDFSGASNLKKLRNELRSKLMIRHLKRDVLKELPPKTRKFIFLDESDKLKPLERCLLQQFTLEDLMGVDHELGDIAKYRKEVGQTKIIPAFTYISELLETSSDKLVVFAHHVDVVESLARMLEPFGSLKVRGGMTAKAKAHQVKLFQSDPKHRVIVGNLESMGIGLTLTKSPGVIIVEPDWRPGINEQAEDRVHRMTQKQNVYIRYLVLRNSLDERMLYQVLSKQDAINQVMD